jgi:hypothetical protein
MHDWDDPIKRFTKAAESSKVHVLTPKIGELVDLDKKQTFSKWWEAIS